jgi:hypothetical protein
MASGPGGRTAEREGRLLPASRQAVEAERAACSRGRSVGRGPATDGSRDPLPRGSMTSVIVMDMKRSFWAVNAGGGAPPPPRERRSAPPEARRHGTVEKFLAKERSDCPAGRQEVLDAALDGEGRRAKLRPRRSAAEGVHQSARPRGPERNRLPTQRAPIHNSVRVGAAIHSRAAHRDKRSPGERECQPVVTHGRTRDEAADDIRGWEGTPRNSSLSRVTTREAPVDGPAASRGHNASSAAASAW